MQIGIKFPTREIGSDAGVIREWAAAARDAGFQHIVVIDGVLGIDPEIWPEWDAAFSGRITARRAYTIEHPFHEAMVVMGFLAAASGLGLVSGVIALPARTTALVAKQAAEVDILCGGRLRLGVGVGWNVVEFAAVGSDFRARGRRIEEQIPLLRALWTQRTVAHEGRFDRIVGAGITPSPIQRPIPIWIGGYAEVALRRVGALADGWYVGPNLAGLDRNLEIVRGAAAAAGRDPMLPFEGHVGIGYGTSIDSLSEQVAAWARAGASHLTVDPMGAGYAGAAHVALVHELAARSTG